MNLEKSLVETPRYQMRKDLVKKLLPDNLEGTSFLEIGSGSGNFSLYLAERKMTGLAIDFSDEAVVITNKRLSKFKDEIKVIKGDFLQLDFKQKFDYIFAFEVLEHIQDDVSALSKIHSLLSDNGVFIFSVPIKKSKWTILDQWAGHYRRYEKEEIKKKLQKSSFKLEVLWSYGFPIDSLTLLIRRLLIRRMPGNIMTTKKEASQISGIDRDLEYKFRFFYNKIFLFPFLILQKIFLRTNLGLGYIIKTKK